MLGSMGIVMTLVVIYAFFGERIPAEIFIGAVTVIFALITFVNYRWILTKGIDKFESL